MKRSFVGQKPTIFPRNRLHERMDEASCTVGKYFVSCHSHDTFGNYNNEPYILGNALYVFPHGILDVNTAGSISLEYSGPIPEIFFDDTLQYTNNASSMGAIRILVSGRFAGHYLPTINTLVLTDWTHDNACLQVFNALWPQLIEKLHLKIPDESARFKTVSEVTVGCDPEFELFDRYGDVVTADEIVDYDCESQIGTDGSGDQIEFRPTPGNPIKVTQNFKKLVREFKEDLGNRFDLTDRGDCYPLGGHIHVGIGFRMTPDSNLLTLLDDFVGEPSMKLSGDARKEYRRLGAYRPQPHGFEYRTPPAALFQNPAITCITLRLVGNLAKNYLNGEVFEYDSGKLTLEDYMKYGILTKNQAKYFMKFCGNGYKPAQSIVVSWKVAKEQIVKRSNIPTVVFQNTWDPYVKEVLTTGIYKIKTARPVTIKLYGLSKKLHGTNKATIPFSYCMLAPGKVDTWDPENRVLSIGISYDRRTSLSIPNSPFIRGLLRAIGNKLNEVEA